MRSASAHPARDGETSGTGRLEEWSSPNPQGFGTESGLYLAGVYLFSPDDRRKKRQRNYRTPKTVSRIPNTEHPVSQREFCKKLTIFLLRSIFWILSSIFWILLFP